MRQHCLEQVYGGALDLACLQIIIGGYSSVMNVSPASEGGDASANAGSEARQLPSHTESAAPPRLKINLPSPILMYPCHYIIQQS